MDILLYIFLGVLVIKHRWDINGKNTIICSRCNRKLENQEHKRKFDQYFQGNENEYDYDPPLVDRRISPHTKNTVWRRDEGRCVECGSKERLGFDHIIQYLKVDQILQEMFSCLCEKCNRIKSDNIL